VLRAVVVFLLLVSGVVAVMAQPVPTTPGAPKPAPAKKQAAPKQAAAPAGSGKCVGVVSRLGETFNVRKIGIIVFQNDEKEASIDSWRVDELVATRVGSFLGGRAAARRLTNPKGAVASLDEIKLFRNYNADLGAILRTLAAGTRCARYIVVNPISTQFLNTNQNLKGAGILDYTSGFNDVYWIHVLATLTVYDGETFAPLESKAASIGQSIFFSDIRGPHRKVDKSFWPESSDAAQNAKLRDGIRELVAESIDRTLPELKQMD
jgi:hypothetical protein